MKSKTYFYIAGAVVVLAIIYFLFLSGDSEIGKVYKSLNAQNFESASNRLKEILYDDEDNVEAKALLFYSKTREYFEDERIRSYGGVLEVTIPNLLAAKGLIYQNKLNEAGYLSEKDKKQFLKDSKDYRHQLSRAGVPTEDMTELTTMLETLCDIGIDRLKIVHGDEVDEAIYACLLAGNSFFGDKQSGSDLMKLSKTNDKTFILFYLCGEEFIDDLKKETENEQSLYADVAKHIVAKSLITNEVQNIFDKYTRMESAITNLRRSSNKIANSFYVDYMNNMLFFNGVNFDDYMEMLEKNNKAGVDISIRLFNNNNIISVYFYNPPQKKYVSRFYSFLDNKISLIAFKENGLEKTEFISDNSPLRFFSYDQNKSEISIASDKSVKKTGYRTEERYNPKKYYDSYYGYSGGYDYVSVPYEYEDVSYSTKTYNLNKDKADFVSEYVPETEAAAK
jgi:hypothetical protein